MSILGIETLLETLVGNRISVLGAAGPCCECCHYGGEWEGTAAAASQERAGCSAYIELHVFIPDKELFAI